MISIALRPLPFLFSVLLVTSCQSPQPPVATAERETSTATSAPPDIAADVEPPPNVFAAAERYVAAGETNKAIEAYLDALEKRPWNLEAQMAAAELLQSVSLRDSAREKATLVWDHALTDRLLVRSARLLAREFDATTLESEPWPEGGYALALVPLGDVEAWLLRDLRKELQSRLEVPVIIRREPFTVPPPGRHNLNLLATDLRRKYSAMHSNPGFVRLLRMNDLTWTGNETDQEVITFAEKIYSARGGEKAVQAFRKEIGVYHHMGSQWDSAVLLNQFCAASGGSVRHPQRLFLGVTAVDLYSSDFRFLAGSARFNESCAVISYRRFADIDPGEPPNRERLRERTLKQALASTGSLLGLHPCKDRTCPRALPQHLTLLDARRPNLCSDCAEAFRKQLRQ